MHVLIGDPRSFIYLWGHKLIFLWPRHNCITSFREFPRTTTTTIIDSCQLLLLSLSLRCHFGKKVPKNWEAFIVRRRRRHNRRRCISKCFHNTNETKTYEEANKWQLISPRLSASITEHLMSLTEVYHHPQVPIRQAAIIFCTMTKSKKLKEEIHNVPDDIIQVSGFFSSAQK